MTPTRFAHYQTLAPVVLCFLAALASAPTMAADEPGAEPEQATEVDVKAEKPPEAKSGVGDAEVPAEEKESAKEEASTAVESDDVVTPDPEWAAKGAFTEPPVKGPYAKDFVMMGEFTGSRQATDGTMQPIGLQLRVIGENQFEARTHLGGLPGAETYDSETRVLSGRRSDATLVLSGDSVAYFVTADRCTIVDAQAQLVGELKRVQRVSPTLGATPPEGAIVVFDGTGTDEFVFGNMTSDGLLEQGASIKALVQDFDLHLEFRLPFMPAAEGQKRGNSGLYLHGRYECQVLDSFGGPKVFNGLGSLYRMREPDLNMAFPPLSWQTYDVRFTAARFNADGSKRRNARLTSWVNGQTVQDDVEVKSKTGAGKEEEAIPLPILLQDHNDPVRYRNIWLVDRGILPGVEFPIMASE
ncbi:MAG: DUF1080 domain-containing protein [Planctomycetota bacterium]